MRLLRIDGEDRFSLVGFTGQDVPPYAILSHTWGPDHEEVTFQDVINNRGREKAGYDKIRFCQRQATNDGLEYFWIDTCCIDKSSSAELTESINSMFKWYEEATVCYVILQDLRQGCALVVELPQCRWFTRGWTLQELLAPHEVRFYDCTWVYIGNQGTLSNLLSSTTGIPVNFLLERNFASASVATKMSWAAKRETKRPEDRAYSLLGIFDVNMPLIYGEGTKAFRRLQEEIIKRCNDLTIFAWEQSPCGVSLLVSPLATSPADFSSCRDVSQHTLDLAEFSITNKGLMLSGDIPLRTSSVVTIGGGNTKLYLVHLGSRTNDITGIYLRKIGPKLFCRFGDLALVDFTDTGLRHRMHEVSGTCVLLDTKPAFYTALTHRTQGIHVPFNASFELRHTHPEVLWDETDRLFLRPKRYVWADYPMVLVMKLHVELNQTTIALAILCHHLNHGPVLKIFSQTQYPQEYEVISQARYRQDGIHVQELDLQARSVRAMTSMARVEAGHQHHHISVTLCQEVLDTYFGPVNVSALCLNIDGRPTQRL